MAILRRRGFPSIFATSRNASSPKNCSGKARGVSRLVAEATGALVYDLDFKTSNLIDDLLNLSRFGRQALNRQVLNMEKLFRETWNELRFSESLSEACELTVTGMSEASGDLTLVKQVVKNLLSNAIKYKKKDTPGRIEAGSTESENSVSYYVRDNGIGFDMRYIDKLFGIFQRLHSSSEYEGTGVGLAIVKRIIQKHGGRVWAEGEPDKGACFYFTLPKNPASS